VKRFAILISFFVLASGVSAPGSGFPAFTGDQIPHLGDLQEIADAGIVKFGTVDLLGLIEQVKTLNVFLDTSPVDTLPETDRRSGLNSSHKKEATIYTQVIASQRSPNSPYFEANSTLFFHEYLGALGYQDQNYELSSILSLTHFLVQLARVRPHYVDKLDRWKKYLSRLSLDKTKPVKRFAQAFGGGSSTTGGGGDYASALYKFILLSDLMLETRNLVEFNQDDLSVLRFILDLRIEVDWQRHWTDRKIEIKSSTDGKGILWLPAFFVLEAHTHKFGPNHPNSVIRYAIRPFLKDQMMASFEAVKSCHSVHRNRVQVTR
jgi:hypothetical protein